MERQPFNTPHEAALSASSADRGNPDRAMSRILTQLIGKPVSAPAIDHDVQLLPPLPTIAESGALQEPFGTQPSTDSAATESTDDGDSANDASWSGANAKEPPPIYISEDAAAEASFKSDGDVAQYDFDDDPIGNDEFDEGDKSEATEDTPTDASDEPFASDFDIETGGSTSSPISASETELSDEPDIYLGERAGGDGSIQPSDVDKSGFSLPGARDGQELSEADRTSELPTSEQANI
jgi:hypothetical protein